MATESKPPFLKADPYEPTQYPDYPDYVGDYHQGPNNNLLE